jgi:hypothetical protein
MKKYAIVIAILQILAACSANYSDFKDDSARQLAKDFGNAYFNCDYQEAIKYVTTESEKWLRFAASNITQEDIELLNSKEEGAEICTDDVQLINDSTAVVTLSVRNFLMKDSIGRSGHIADEGIYQLTIIYRDKKCYVRMEGLPRNERQSHD